MREFVLSILALWALATRVTGSELGKDGFNYYKDFARGPRSDDALGDAPEIADRMLYFYRTPAQLYPGLLPAVLEQEYRKRTGNAAFKNHMLNKDAWGEHARKRSSKTALSLMMANKHEPNNDEYILDIPD